MVCPFISHSENQQFSFQSRELALKRFALEKFDLLIIGGGITGAGAARDAASRGLKVALIEKHDFAFGTSSRSSKLIHGGFRYLEQFEFGLVHEALSERTHLLESIPHLVKPLLFYLPTYKWSRLSKSFLDLGLWVYDILALGKAKKFHRRLSKSKILKALPFLEKKDSTGGLLYSDALMWDDIINVDNLRSAQDLGATVANYVEAINPIWENDQIKGYEVKDLENPDQENISIHAHKVIFCGGPWTDLLGEKTTSNWKPWLSCSKGIHINFPLEKFPIKEAVVMATKEDGRFSFAIPRPDYGPGITIVGTTDGPSPKEPEDIKFTKEDIDYLFDLINLYFSKLNLKKSDLISAYAGLKPLINPALGHDEDVDLSRLQDVSREHHIDTGPGGVVIVAGGKYTTYRTMAIEIVDFTLKEWRKDAIHEKIDYYPRNLKESNTKIPLFPQGLPENVELALEQAKKEKIELPKKLIENYGADALVIYGISQNHPSRSSEDPDGFPLIEAQLRYHIRNGMVIHLDDFYMRRQPLYMARKDHTLPWAENLSHVLAEERNLSEDQRKKELDRLQEKIEYFSQWKEVL